MKKLISVLLILTISASMLWGCGGEKMEVPAYPLSAADIEAQLEAQGLDWTVAEEAADPDDQACYSLYDGENKKIAVVDSRGDENSRYLNITFMSTLREEENSTVIEVADWVKIITCGTALYGGFSDENAVYKGFIKGGKRTGKIRTYFREDMVDEDDKIYEEIYKWTAELDGTSCMIKLGQPEKVEEAGLDSPAQELVSITFYNDEKYAGDEASAEK